MKPEHLRLKHAYPVRLCDDDYREIEATARKLGLPVGDIIRRSLRIALPILRDLKMPGSPRRRISEEPLVEQKI
jgi:hypothetical protein